MIKVGKTRRDTSANANGQSTDTQRTRYELESSDVGRTLPNYKGHEYSSYTIKRGDVGKVVEYIHEDAADNVLQRIIDATIKQGMMLPPSMTLSAMEQEWTNHEWADWLCRWQKEYPELYAMVPVHLYEHSGLSFSVGGFSDSWDSGLIGYLMVDRERWDKQHGGSWSQGEAIRVLTGEVQTLDNYHSYGVQGFRIDRVTLCECCGTEKEEELESCWGFYEWFQSEATDDRPQGWQAVLDMRDNVGDEYKELFND